jgi:hypothetical protein
MKKSLGRVEEERDHSGTGDFASELSFEGFRESECVAIRSQMEAIKSRYF